MTQLKYIVLSLMCRLRPNQSSLFDAALLAAVSLGRHQVAQFLVRGIILPSYEIIIISIFPFLNSYRHSLIYIGHFNNSFCWRYKIECGSNPDFGDGQALVEACTHGDLEVLSIDCFAVS
jgi:hypothetical protein